MSTEKEVMAGKTAEYRLPPVEIFEPMADEAAPAISDEEVERVKSIIIKATEGTNAKVSELKFGISSDKLPRSVKVNTSCINVKAGCSHDEWRVMLEPRTRGKAVTREDLETIIYGIFKDIKRDGHASVSTDLPAFLPRYYRCLDLQINRADRKFLSLRRAFESKAWRKADGAQPFVAGEGVGGRLLVADLTIPFFKHCPVSSLFVGGATGQGKSVFLHGIIASLLCRQRPEDVKLILVDTKGVEFGAYARLGKSFLAQMPDGGDAIINDAGKGFAALGSLYAEMKLRRALMAKAGLHFFGAYNSAFAMRRLSAEDGHRDLPRMVMIIDEYADIIRHYGHAFEIMACDIAKFGCEVGIHFIISTQRVTTDIVTKDINDAFSETAAFRVSTQIDSRTLIDAEGAEVLCGKGDMIFWHYGGQERLQAPYVSPAEIDRLVDHVRKASDAAGCSQGYTLPEPDTSDLKQ